MVKPDFMGEALNQARLAGARGEVPIGAVVVHAGRIVSAAGNETRALADPTAHAEILAIRQACRSFSNERLPPETDLYVTLEPCAMCAAAISFARVTRLYFAAEDQKGGGVINGGRFFASPTCHHAPEIYSAIRETEAAEMLRGFFRDRR